MATSDQAAGADGRGGEAVPGAPQTKSLRKRLMSGGAWTLGSSLIALPMRLGSNLILTRLLLPEAFGLMAMIITVHMALEMISDVGIRLSVVRSERGEDPRFLRVAWTVQLLRAALGGGMVVAIAGLVAVLGPVLADPGTVYADPLLPWLLLVSSLQFLLQGSASSSLFLAARRIEYTKVTLLDLSTQAVSTAITISLAFATHSVWAMVIGTISGLIYRSAMSHHWLDGPRMRVEWDRDIAAELWNYGKWLIGASILTYVARNAHRLILAGLMAAGPFGVLAVAMIWVDAGLAILNRVSGNLIIQTLSETRRTAPERLGHVFARTMLLFDAGAIIACLVCMFGAETMVQLLYEERMHGIAGHLQVLALAFLALRFQVFNSQMLSKGDSKGHLLSMAVEAATVCIAVPLGFEVAGVAGALGALVLAPIAAAPVAVLRAGRDVGASIPFQFAYMAATLAIAGVVIFG